jgi:hypothetical protein
MTTLQNVTNYISTSVVMQVHKQRSDCGCAWKQRHNNWKLFCEGCLLPFLSWSRQRCWTEQCNQKGTWQIFKKRKKRFAQQLQEFFLFGLSFFHSRVTLKIKMQLHGDGAWQSDQSKLSGRDRENEAWSEEAQAAKN